MLAWLPVMAEPPLYSADAIRRLTLDEILDANEVLNVRTEIARRAAAAAAKK